MGLKLTLGCCAINAVPFFLLLCIPFRIVRCAASGAVISSSTSSTTTRLTSCHFTAITSSFLSRQGKAHRDKQLVYLKDHLDQIYYSRERKWIVLFPEGGFLRKRRETSQAFAKKHDLPHLTHVTLPRLGATQVILKTLGPQQENGTLEAGDATTTRQTGTHGQGCHK